MTADIPASAMKALQSRRHTVVKQLDSLAKELAALDLVLGEGEPRGGVRVVVRKRRRVAELKEPSGSGHTGFRDRVRKILAAHPKGLRPAEARAEVEHSGFVPAGKTKLAVRVPNELHRLVRIGEVERTQNGKYRLVT